MNDAARNISTVSTRMKRSVSRAFNLVAGANPSFESVKFLRKVGKQMRSAAKDLPLASKRDAGSEGFAEMADKRIGRIEQIVEAGFTAGKMTGTTDDARLGKLASTQIRNSLRPVNFLKPAKVALNAKVPNIEAAATQVEMLADSLEVGLHLQTGNTTKARHRIKALTDAGYAPVSVVRHLVH